MNRADAGWLASRIRTSPFFDAETSQGLPGGLQSAMHSAVIGELLEPSPSQDFDPAFYVELHEDVARNGLSPLYHYMSMGAERPPGASRHQQVGISASNVRRPTVLILAHEFLRTWRTRCSAGISPGDWPPPTTWSLY